MLYVINLSLKYTATFICNIASYLIISKLGNVDVSI